MQDLLCPRCCLCAECERDPAARMDERQLAVPRRDVAQLREWEIQFQITAPELQRAGFQPGLPVDRATVHPCPAVRLRPHCLPAPFAFIAFALNRTVPACLNFCMAAARAFFTSLSS